jgi:hypothetical protein
MRVLVMRGKIMVCRVKYLDPRGSSAGRERPGLGPLLQVVGQLGQ